MVVCLLSGGILIGLSWRGLPLLIKISGLRDHVEYQKKIALGYATRVNDLETELNQRKLDMKA
jgi:hypothetical protein